MHLFIWIMDIKNTCVLCNSTAHYSLQKDPKNVSAKNKHCNRHEVITYSRIVVLDSTSLN